MGRLGAPPWTSSKLLASLPEMVAEHGLSEEEYGRILKALGREPNLRRARHLLGDVVGALQLQELTRPFEEAADGGAMGDLRSRRECRSDRHRRRRRGDLQDGEPQPPVIHRALSGRGDGRRRDPARRVHHGRPADRQFERAALRAARSSQDAASRRGRGRGDRRLRQLRRSPDRRRRGQFRRSL